MCLIRLSIYFKIYFDCNLGYYDIVTKPKYPQNFLYFPEKNKKKYFSNKKIFHTLLKEPNFYPENTFFDFPEKVSYTCPKTPNFLNQNNFL